ncbi:MAG: DUF3793 family protein [Lachnospiraceae bacterium]|nr:DUF3793 family protein [Lachnospiraceae bacterium]MCD8124427.1 DUF3793 family protein [Lachnospiraceae bacterium]
MSQDILEMMQAMDPEGLSRQLVMQCAPLITGLKMSNLLMIPRACEAEVKSLLRDTELSWFTLRCTSRKTVMLLYRERELREYLESPAVREILKEAGYHEFTFRGTLREMRERYRSNRQGESAFPHEMGVFLGYPVSDVRGFIEKDGQDFLYSGYWKVYEGVEEKKRIFRGYETARDTLIELLSGGLTLSELLTATCGLEPQAALSL